MNRLQKFVELRAQPAEKLRTAYALGAERLPAPEAGAAWHLVDNLSADELLEMGALRGVFQIAIADGHAVLPPDAER